MAGYIKLYRQMKKWEWYSDTNTKCLFLHCLLSANHEPGRWQGIDIAPGSFVTSIDHLGSELGLSVQQIRTSLHRLEQTGELSRKSTNRFTTITVVKWVDYQGCDSDDNKPITNKQQTDNKRITTNKNEKNEKNDNKKHNTLVGLIIGYLNDQSGRNFKVNDANARHILARLNEGYTLVQFYRVIHTMTYHWEQDAKMQTFLRPETLFGSKFDSYLNRDFSDNTQAELWEIKEKGFSDLANGSGKWKIDDNSI